MQVYDENKEKKFICAECGHEQPFVSYLNKRRGCAGCGTTVKVIDKIQHYCKKCIHFESNTNCEEPDNEACRGFKGI